MSFKCPVCGTDADNSEKRPNKSNHSGIRCPRCGDYYCGFQYIDRINHADLTIMELAKICGYLRNNQDVAISLADIEELKDIKMPSLSEKADKLLLHFAKKHPIPGDIEPIIAQSPEGWGFLGVSYSSSWQEFQFILKYLVDSKKYLEMKTMGKFLITDKGWGFIDSLNSLNPKGNTVFVAMRFQEELLNTIYKKGIKSAIEDCGFEPKIMTEHVHLITSAIKYS